MIIKNLNELEGHCHGIHDDSFFNELIWEMSDDDSGFVCAEFSYEADGRIYYFHVYTEDCVYVAKNVDTEVEQLIVWTSAPRNP